MVKSQAMAVCALIETLAQEPTCLSVPYEDQMMSRQLLNTNKKMSCKKMN